MSSSSRPSRRPALALALPTALLSLALAGPAHAAEPGGDPNGGDRGRGASEAGKGQGEGQGKSKGQGNANGKANGKANGNAKGKAKGKSNGKGQADHGNRGQAAPGAKAQGPKERPDAPDAPGAPGAPGAPAQEAPGAGTPPGQAGREQRKVVVCKYVRKPGATEIPHHVIVVDYHALEGDGFTGSFPYPFSDGQVGSVAVRYAEDGEQAREISLAGCPTSSEVPGEELPGEEVPGEEVPGEEVPEDEVPGEQPAAGTPDEGAPGLPDENGEVLGLVVAAPADLAATREAAADATDERGGFLPATGSPEHLALLAAVGGLCAAAGAGLLVARRRRSA
ncbi:LPXTG cell wall anchor domain-containing protein [Nocardioides sp. SYSU DS0651]|uniref:LPXTG cell wall anchor domain-containing protein n=1 Tax=Nocardioides sp. SYSU DS0651 TaxID=3415955 RepID=UPI003F4BC550